MLKNPAKMMLSLFLGIVLCFSFVQLSQASTSVYFDNSGALSDVASFNFTILDPVSASTADFTKTLPSGWLDFSSGDLVSAFDATGTASLPTGSIGSSGLDLILGNWVFGNQSAVTLGLGTDYFVHHAGTDYYVTASPTAPVPIPGALWLLGSGLIGMVGVRRKLNKS